jgi:predicted helicase
LGTDKRIKDYLTAIDRELARGKTTEHTHRPALKAFVESLGDVLATNEPGREKCGAPDYVVTKSGPITVGYIETKDVGKPLGDVERSEQLQRYRRSLPNLILTDYLEFRWYVNGEPRKAAVLAAPGKGGKLALAPTADEAVSLLTDFLAHTPEPISTPKELAERMARLTHIIRDVIVEAFRTDYASQNLKDLRKAFASTLIPDLDTPKKAGEFADMYAQTIAYGLFAARCNHPGTGPFRRVGAAAEIPKTNPFLRKLFEMITGTELDEEPYLVFVDDLVQVLDHAAIETILKDFGRRTKQEDPVVHFYETFLAQYDPKLRESRGVYYTPEPVVSYIVRSVDQFLKERFALPAGLADTTQVHYEWEHEQDGKKVKHEATAPRVLVLDPACGTATFLYSVVDHIRQVFMDKDNAGMWSSYVEQQLLSRLYGFELLMAPYAVAHFKLGLQLSARDLSDALRRKWAYDFSANERLSVYLTNTLEQVEKQVETLLGQLRIISEEATAADHVKRNLPILAVIGNPPYSGHSSNRSWRLEKYQVVPKGKGKGKGKEQPKPEEKTRKVMTFIGELIREYYFVDGQPLRERNPKWLQDDYVKFLRWGQWRIQRTGAGVLAFVTNHSYLDNPTFRGMRQSLINTFTEIYLLNLHGNSKKNEHCPDGSRDVNVFDIQQGVAIGLFVKEPGKTQPARVHYADLWGEREHKYKFLWSQDFKSTEWQELKPESPFYFFFPQDPNLRAEYEKGRSMTDISPVNNLGFQSHRDPFAIAFGCDEMTQRVEDMRGTKLSDSELRGKYGLAGGWDVGAARTAVRKDSHWQEKFSDVLYRPFDKRHSYFSTAVMDRPRRELLAHVAHHENLCINTVRQTKMPDWHHAVVSNCPTPAVYVEIKDGSNLFPLYLYPEAGIHAHQQQSLIGPQTWEAGKDGRVPNLSRQFIAEIESRFGLKFVSDGKGDLKGTVGPEDVFAYIYAVLNCPSYQSRYSDFLKLDFPRVRLVADNEQFVELSSLGMKLIQAHLMYTRDPPVIAVSFPVVGENVVHKSFPRFTDINPKTGDYLDECRVYINETQYFENVPQEVWEAEVGGYQVCYQWIKDRRGEVLSYADQSHYERLVPALYESLQVIEEIEAVAPNWSTT